MATPTGLTVRETTRRRRKGKLAWSTCWSNSLKEIACLLPIVEPSYGQGFTKKQRLIHMLQYFDFLKSKIQTLQSHLPPWCIPQDHDAGSGSESEEDASPEPCPPPFRAKRRYACNRARKRAAAITGGNVQEKKINHVQFDRNGNRTYTSVDEDKRPPMWGLNLDCLDVKPDHGHLKWQVCNCKSLPRPIDSALSPGQAPTSPLEGSGGALCSEAQMSADRCSVCEDCTGSESSPGSTLFDTPPIGSGSLLRDGMLGAVSSFGGWMTPFTNPHLSPARNPKRASLFPLFGTGDSLNLSPSLLNSPARGLTHCLLPDGQEDLLALFEDVWVTPKTSHTKVLSLPSQDPTDLQLEVEAPLQQCPGSWQSSHSEEEDITWTPKQKALRKKNSAGRRRRKAESTTKQQLPLVLKKKCVNGFIMFCRDNRKMYLHSYPGTPSTVVTKELASLWHVLPKQERRVYCLKARRFSRQQNRNVRLKGVEAEAEEEEENCAPSPLHLLLAQKDLVAVARDGR